MIRRRWLRLPIDRKVQTFAWIVALMIALAVGFNIVTMRFSLRGYGDILAANLSCQEFMDAMDDESRRFRNFIEERSEANRKALTLAEERTERAISALPFRYEEIGAERYARTWSIQNAYGEYSRQRNDLVETGGSGEGYITRLYRIYTMQGYMDSYARRLLQSTVAEGSVNYAEKLPVFRSMPFVLLNITVIILFLIVSMSRLMSDAIVAPVKKLSDEARRITENDFYSPDLEIENQDEIGELGETFNIMKRSMGNYIGTLKENHRMTELLQKEQMENIEMEKRLEANRLELLKSQINPHFLFNTLNMIGSMADLEGAESTEKMTHSLASLFRYNLSTQEQKVSLSQEMVVAENYMYLQKMRFGSRVRYEVHVPEELRNCRIPSFTLQPLIENAVVHGISRKERGGKVVLRVRAEGELLRLMITDDGLGMTEEKKEELQAALRASKPAATARVGIGIGNIYLRVHKLYPAGEFLLYSRVGKGCSVVIRIPRED